MWVTLPLPGWGRELSPPPGHPSVTPRPARWPAARRGVWATLFSCFFGTAVLLPVHAAGVCPSQAFGSSVLVTSLGKPRPFPHAFRHSRGVQDPSTRAPNLLAPGSRDTSLKIHARASFQMWCCDSDAVYVSETHTLGLQINGFLPTSTLSYLASFHVS